MNEKGKTTLDTCERIRKDLLFKNIIIKNSCRLRQKSNDDYANSKILTDLEPVRRKIKYIKKEKNDLLESNDNISVDLNTNLVQNNHIKKRFYLNFNFGNKEQKPKIVTERIIENKIEENIFNKIKIIKVNQTKKIPINHDYSSELTKTEYNLYENNNKGNNNNFKYNNDDIKNSIADLKKNLNTNGQRKINWKRSNSISKIMNSLYYNSYTTEKDERVTEEKPIKLNKKTKLKIINNNDYLIDNEKLFSKSNIIIKNKISIFTNNLNIIKIKKEKNGEDKSRENKHIYITKNNIKGNKLNLIRDIHPLRREENSFLTNDEKGEIIRNNKFKLIKVKMAYQKSDTKNATELDYVNNKIINQNNNYHKLKKRRINENNEINKTTNNQPTENIIKRGGNYISPRIRYKQKRIMLLDNKKDNVFNLNNINFEKNNYLWINNINRNNYSNLNSKNNNEKEKDNFYIQFFDDIIELCNGIEEKTMFKISIKKINKKYIINFGKISFENIINNSRINFDFCFKYFCIILISFCFLSKEGDLYTNNSEKIHLLFIQYIYSALCLIGYQDLNSKNIKRFLSDYNLYKNVSIIQCTKSIIKILFEEREEYICMNKILKQLMVNINRINISKMIKIINETILFCFNQTIYNKYSINSFQSNNLFSSFINHREEFNKNEKSIAVPYIKTNLQKPFCLVLDLDETISHSIKLSSGNYFFLRPRTIEFLKELSQFYEIIIFTSSPKEYADDILDKIDPNNNLITHRLYKSHVFFEKGKSVKKLELIGRDLNKIIFVDNLKYNAKYNLKNLYLIPSWTDDIFDEEINKLKKKLKYIYESGKFNDDVTKGL